jgi:tRNA 2-selenouridine synthase
LHEYTILDVRTPLEFEKGHIPGAFNIPLLSNEERVLVGTCFKQQSRQAAIKLGFQLVGGKWTEFIEQAEALCAQKPLLVHCWRGGMRSGSMAWAFDMYGLPVHTLVGGYKAYRSTVLDSFQRKFNLQILSGKTGSGKTLILEQLRILGQQVIDLEGLAQHQGSSFGSKGYLVQPSQETFENSLHALLNSMDPAKPIWIESESIVIGKRVIPKSFFVQMEQAPTVDIQLPREVRLDYLTEEYGQLDKDFLQVAVEGIAKRLGPEQTRDTMLAIQENRMRDFIHLVLVYYDKQYEKAVQKRSPETVTSLAFETLNPVQIAQQLIQQINA